MKQTLVVLILGVMACTGGEGPAGPAGPEGPAGPAGDNGPAGTNGTNGTNGSDGADGQLRIYGDGTAGAVTITADTDWTTSPPPNDNYQFTNFTIAAGVTLHVWSGTVIRCTGTCTNNGTVAVSYGAVGGVMCMNAGVGAAEVVEPAPDVFGFVAGMGEVTATNTPAFGGVGYGPNLGITQAVTNVGLEGGGGGAGNGGGGGGTLTVLAQTSVVNATGATIVASGQDADMTTGCQQGGGGGGGGGIVILASKGSVTQAGTIDVHGGAGGPEGTFWAAGGGGAGGIVHLFAPAVTHTGTETLTAGAQGTGTATLTANPRGAGSSGGSSGGAPGVGANVTATNTIAATAAATAGHSFTSLVDPTALFY